jgi:hypothetical protein
MAQQDTQYLVEIARAEPVRVLIHGQPYTLTPPTLGDVLAMPTGGPRRSEAETGYEMAIRMVHAAMRPHHPEVTEQWLRGVFTTADTEALNTIVEALTGGNAPAASADSPPSTPATS